MFYCDPKHLASKIGRIYLLLILDDSVLDPLKVHRVVDVTYMIGIGSKNLDRVIECRCSHHITEVGPAGHSYNARTA